MDKEHLELVGPGEAARILGVCETTQRTLTRRGQLVPAMFVNKRPVFKAADVRALRAQRDANESARRALQLSARSDSQAAA
jgi:hypothetical protein